MDVFSDSYALPLHGGDLMAAEQRFGLPAAGWLDLSTGINPHAYPLPDLPAAVWRRLPDRTGEAALRAAAARCWGAVDGERVAVAAGSQALIGLLPRLRPPSRVAVIGPTYGEHAACWAAAGHGVQPCDSLDGIGDADVVVVVNPNNPDGRRHDPARLRQLAKDLERRDGLLVVDEAFGDLAPDLSLVGAVDDSVGLVVLRSFGKFWGLAGLRLGFAIAAPLLAGLLRQLLGPWSVSGPAIAIGCRALDDATWATVTRRQLGREAGRLDGVLKRAGLTVAGGTALFRLINAPRAWALYEHLGQRGILVRPFADSPRWLRCGLPPDEAGLERLWAALEDWKE